MFVPIAEVVFTPYDILPVKPVSRPSASAMAEAAGAGFELLKILSLAAISCRARIIRLASELEGVFRTASSSDWL